MPDIQGAEHGPELSAHFADIIEGADPRIDVSELREALLHARIASNWYSRMLDASNRLYDRAGMDVLHSVMVDPPAPQVDPLELARSKLNFYSRMDVDVTPESTQVHNDDYAQLRAGVCRHTECRLSYCIRTKKGTKPPEQYCRFEEGLSVRSHCGEDPENPSTPPTPSHYFAESAAAKDGTPLIHWQVSPLYLCRIETCSYNAPPLRSAVLHW